VEILFELLAQLLLEVLIELFPELLLELVWRSLREVLQPRAEKEPVLAFLGYALLGAAAGALSLLPFPHAFVHGSKWHGMSLIVSPVLAGVGMSIVGWFRRRRGEPLIRLDTFPYGFSLAFGVALVRFLCTARAG